MKMKLVVVAIGTGEVSRNRSLKWHRALLATRFFNIRQREAAIVAPGAYFYGFRAGTAVRREDEVCERGGYFVE